MPNLPEPAKKDSPAASGGVAWVREGLRVLMPIALLVGGWFLYKSLSVPEEREMKPRGQPQFPKTRVVRVEPGDFQPMIETSGTVRAHDEITLTTQVAGRIVAMHQQFEDGAFFAKGDVLVELEEADFLTAVATANSQVAQAKAVHAQEEARSKQARLNWDDLGYDEEPNELVLRLPQLREAAARVVAAEAGLARAERDLARSKIRAPYDGRVRMRSVGISQTVGVGTDLGTIFAVDFAEVRLPVAADQMRFLDLPEEPGDKAVPVVLRDALDPENEAEWAAQIVRAEGALNQDSLELFAIARIENPFGRGSNLPPLRIGQPVVAKVPGRVLEDVVAVPREAVRQLSRITVVDPDAHTITKHLVAPVWSNDTHLVLRDEVLADGALLATANFSRTPDGSQVEILPDTESEEQ